MGAVVPRLYGEHTDQSERNTRCLPSRNVGKEAANAIYRRCATRSALSHNDLIVTHNRSTFIETRYCQPHFTASESWIAGLL